MTRPPREEVPQNPGVAWLTRQGTGLPPRLRPSNQPTPTPGPLPLVFISPEPSFDLRSGVYCRWPPRLRCHLPRPRSLALFCSVSVVSCISQVIALLSELPAPPHPPWWQSLYFPGTRDTHTRLDAYLGDSPQRAVGGQIHLDFEVHTP